MKPRMNFYQAAPDTIKALSALEAQVQGSGLEQSLIELVKTRASQINGCAFCAAPVSAECLAGIAALYRPRTRRAGLDRGSDADLGNPRSR